ncbi:NAD-dependent succinate-semialdehyde dehydrogenase [Mycobacterium sp. 050272]|uniref:NAD-dependent succinate-semialdehyde dehydrogenase n=1 Tax=Mycobacterium sp. 050272 TaxID=3142488 RepID=UPI0031848F08
MSRTITVEFPGTARRHTVPTGLHIDGEWVDLGETFDVVDPATGQPFASVSDGTGAHARAALDAAHRAQVSWADVAPRVRGDLMHGIHQLLTDRADAFTDVMVIEAGKPRSEAAGEMALTLDFVKWLAEQAAHVHGSFSRASRGDFRIIATEQPVGPSLLISPWNFPVLVPSRKAVAALAAGCTAIMKPAEQTPLTSALLMQTIIDAGVPAGVMNLVHTSRPGELSTELLLDRRLRKVSFTGSVAVGSLMMRQAARNVVSVQLELGGNGPFIVLDDADVGDAVAAAVAAKFRNAGQACVAANRIILQRGVAEEFTELFVEEVRRLVVGPGHRPGVDVGPMISEAQRQAITGTVQGVVGAQADALVGGKPVGGDGYFFEPTVLTMRDKAPEFSCRELFAPVAPLFVVDSIDEAVAFANDTQYGLAGYLFTRDISRAMSVSERLDVGMVGVNRGLMADPAAPFGGVKSSGLGREGGHHALEEFMETKYIALTTS